MSTEDLVHGSSLDPQGNLCSTGAADALCRLKANTYSGVSLDLDFPAQTIWDS